LRADASVLGEEQERTSRRAGRAAAVRRPGRWVVRAERRDGLAGLLLVVREEKLGEGGAPQRRVEGVLAFPLLLVPRAGVVQSGFTTLNASGATLARP